MRDQYKQQAVIMKAFCDERRLQILAMLTQGERCACALLEELVISQSTLSHHMKILRSSQIVKERKDGRWVYYSLAQEGVLLAKNYLEEYMVCIEESAPVEC